MNAGTPGLRNGYGLIRSHCLRRCAARIPAQGLKTAEHRLAVFDVEQLPTHADSDRRFRFKPDWAALGGRHETMPTLPDHFAVIDEATEAKPYRLVTAPARTFLNSTFTETDSSLRREKQPLLRMHADDCARLGIAEGDAVLIGNEAGSVTATCGIRDGQQPGVVVLEGIWPNRSFREGVGINRLTSASLGAPKPVGPSS
ncbi:MAG: molybdopterin dinucleotide binding domain-containing protein [Burkholderiaceae bacterium]